jgi:uroporphyrinogen-III synthase
MKRVLVLRPEPGASRTVEAARQRGLDPVSAPLFEIEPLAWEAPEASRFDALLLTSANAVRHGGNGVKGLRALPVHAVGQATADAARDAGFSVASVGSEGVEQLLASLPRDLRVLHLAGQERVLPGNAAQAITVVPVYSAKALPSPDLTESDGSVALIHSARAGRRLAELVANRGEIAIAAISSTAADAAGNGWAAVEVAERPDDEALLVLAARLCNNA